MMRPIYIKELQHYTKENLIQLFGKDEKKTISLIKRLKGFNVLKQVSRTKKDLSDLANDEVLDVELDADTTYFQFTFVGVLNVDNLVFICYPKYIDSSTEPKDEMKQIVDVLKKYHSKQETINMLNGSGDNTSFNMLAVMVYLLNDYFKYGIYSNQMEIVESNGPNEILWDDTINETFAIIQDGIPYYVDLRTKKTVDDNMYYIKLLHESLLTSISNELEQSSLLEIFDLSPINLSGEPLSSMGDKEYILYMLNREIDIQYDTHKKLLLKAMYTYFSQGKALLDENTYSLFGTNSFNLVWETVCAETIDNQLQKQLVNLPLKLAEQYHSQKTTKLIDLIEKPKWYTNENTPIETATLKPDTVAIEKGCFYIIDAKYYKIQIKENSVEGQPGLESITKQYEYQLAYQNFIKDHKLTTRNCFLGPTEKDEIKFLNHVEMPIFKRLGLENINVRMLPAREMYELYLKGGKFEISRLELLEKKMK